jgi:hypothetical protein
VVAEQLVVVGPTGLAGVVAAQDLPEDARDRRPSLVGDLVAAARRPAAVAGAALLARPAGLAEVV